MKPTHKLGQFEGTVPFALGVALLLIAWHYGWTVLGIGAAVLAIVSLPTALSGLSLIARPRDETPVRTSHLRHDVHDRAHEGHPCDTESL